MKKLLIIFTLTFFSCEQHYHNEIVDKIYTTPQEYRITTSNQGKSGSSEIDSIAYYHLKSIGKTNLIIIPVKYWVETKEAKYPIEITKEEYYNRYNVNSKISYNRTYH